MVSLNVLLRRFCRNRGQRYNIFPTYTNKKAIFSKKGCPTVSLSDYYTARPLRCLTDLVYQSFSVAVFSERSERSDSRQAVLLKPLVPLPQRQQPLERLLV